MWKNVCALLLAAILLGATACTPVPDSSGTIVSDSMADIVAQYRPGALKELIRTKALPEQPSTLKQR